MKSLLKASALAAVLTLAGTTFASAEKQKVPAGGERVIFTKAATVVVRNPKETENLAGTKFIYGMTCDTTAGTFGERAFSTHIDAGFVFMVRYQGQDDDGTVATRCPYNTLIAVPFPAFSEAHRLYVERDRLYREMVDRGIPSG